MQANQIEDLLKRYTRGQCTEEEKALVESTYLQYLPEVAELQEEDIEADLAWIRAGLPKDPQRFRIRIFRFAAAAAVLVVVGAGLLYYGLPKNAQNLSVAIPKREHILPGTDKAILTLADGRKIVLDKNASTLLSDSSAGINIRKTAKGELIYEIMKGHDMLGNANAFNTIETPRGSQYKVILPDGTNVWVNAASSLKYPLVFKGAKRNVELTGEAYFEVAKNKHMPFVVHTGDQQVEVLGTHFNINAYADEQEIKTTLLEGSVVVSKGNERAAMSPGQQVINTKNSKALYNTYVEDASESIAWKNGIFLFNHEDYYSIMNRLSRWYDIEVTYQGDFSHQYFSGSISKFEEVTAILKIMEYTHAVKFKIVGRRIIVMK